MLWNNEARYFQILRKISPLFFFFQSGLKLFNFDTNNLQIIAQQKNVWLSSMFIYVDYLVHFFFSMFAYLDMKFY